MSLSCNLGVHRWERRWTDRPGTSVYRCRNCARRVVLHRHRRRQAKRYWLLGAFTLSVGMWFVMTNLALHGRTRVLYTTGRAVDTAQRIAGGAHAALHRVQGDRGRYVEGAPRSGR